MSVIRLYGAWEAAEFLGVTKQALFHWRKNDPLFPEPAEELRSGPVWTHEQLEQYKDNKVGNVGRLNLRDVRGVLELARDTFQFYADQHIAKAKDENLSPQKIQDTLEKAAVNIDLVGKIQSVLRGDTPEDAPWIT